MNALLIMDIVEMWLRLTGNGGGARGKKGFDCSFGLAWKVRIFLLSRRPSIRPSRVQRSSVE